ncbi:MAG: ABC transporter permease [Vicingaceae bacterium]
MKSNRYIRLGSARRSLRFLKLLVVVAILAPALANEKPLLLLEDGAWSLPFLKSGAAPDLTNARFYIPAPIPYGESSIDYAHSGYYSPFSKQMHNSWHQRHWLGTDGLGRDVLSQLIYGCQTALWVGLGAVSIALLIGLFIGGISAVLGDDQLKYSRLRIGLMSLIVLFSIGLLIVLPPYQVETASWLEVLSLLGFCLLLSLLLFGLSHWLLIKWEKKAKPTLKPLALDLYLNRLVEVIESLPLILLILALSSLLQGGLASLILVIGLSSWTGIAKMFRAEILRAKEMGYVESGRALGFKDARLLMVHMLPNALPPILVKVSFGVAAVILIEASFSFLGLGLSAEEASWGALLAESRNNFEAWWIALFPGLAIFFTLLACNKVGDALSNSRK